MKMSYNLVYRVCIIYFLTILVGCVKPTRCPDGRIIENQFNERLSNLNSIRPNEVLGSQELLNIFTLSNLTMIESHVSFGDVSVYSSENDRDEDVNNWTNWFEENKCSISSDTLEKIDSVILSKETWLVLPTTG